MKKMLQIFLLKTAENYKCRTDAKGLLQGWSGVGALLVAALITAPSPANAADVEQLVTTVCAACHGADGKSVAPMFPNLAGQHSVYLTKQLNDYIDGRRKNDIMSPNAAALKSDDIAAIAAYFSSKKPVPGTAGDAQLIEAGRTFYMDGNTESGVPGCVGCHMEEGVGNKIYPRLAGQNSAYIVQQLSDFKSGVRINDNGKLMRSVAARMTDEEIKAIAEYLAVAGQ